ncbi:zinc transporter zipt-7.2-like isoform X2 [Penaeus chinensis]|nr:zinc transporter zipt-7.2-like isoform X2 [Penaeus chinensis]
MFRDIFLLFLIGLAVSAAHPVGQEENGLDYVLQNLTAIWEELTYLRNEVDGHFHGGHEGQYHHQVVEEVGRMNHERHVHHLHHPHESHSEHHDSDLLRHLAHHGLDQRQRPSHSHQHPGKEDQGEDHDDGGEESGEDNSAERHQEHHADDHDTHGLHTLGDYDLDAFNLRDLTSDQSHGHSHTHGHGYGTSHSHHHSHDHGHDHDHELSHSADSHEADNSQEGTGKQSFRSPAQAAPGRGLALIPGREPISVVPVDPWMYGNCDLKPNVDVPESAVRGSITISQLKSGKGPVYFDLNITGFDVASTGLRHGFHVHDLPVTDGSCGSTGGHFNPHAQTHGAQDASVRHVGDLGNIEVDEDGNLEGHILSDRLVAFSGPNKIIGRAIVVHAGEDDLGLGGDAGSLSTGNAGGRLACCTIHMKIVPYFRFKG